MDTCETVMKCANIQIKHRAVIAIIVGLNQIDYKRMNVLVNWLFYLTEICRSQYFEISNHKPKKKQRNHPLLTLAHRSGNWGLEWLPKITELAFSGLAVNRMIEVIHFNVELLKFNTALLNTYAIVLTFENFIVAEQLMIWRPQKIGQSIHALHKH
jgi:hypothetical protein